MIEPTFLHIPCHSGEQLCCLMIFLVPDTHHYHLSLPQLFPSALGWEQGCIDQAILHLGKLSSQLAAAQVTQQDSSAPDAEGTGRGMGKPTLGPDSHLGGLGAKAQGLTLSQLIEQGLTQLWPNSRIRAFSSWDSAGMWVGEAEAPHPQGPGWRPNHFLKMSLELWDLSFPVSLRQSGILPLSPSVSEVWRESGKRLGRTAGPSLGCRSAVGTQLIHTERGSGSGPEL